MTRSVKVGFAAPREVAFDFLVDPHNRMQWQSGLRAVEDVQPDASAGRAARQPELRPPRSDPGDVSALVLGDCGRLSGNPA